MTLGAFNALICRSAMSQSMRGLRAAVLAATALLPNDTVVAATQAKPEMQITEKDRNYWAFRMLSEVLPPGGGVNGVDAFLFPEETPLPKNAARSKLIRRLYLDLLGLPPTPEQVAFFQRDPSPDAYERLVDQLLANRHFGERWARHWLDLARYADSDGYEDDLDRREGWPYRDWVIRAFNEDLPFHTFLQWQIAGDEIAPTLPDAVIATGFLAAAPSQGTTPADTEENKLKIRYDELDDMVSTSASAFLGLTLGCARCHDHKFDPLPTRDYYRMAAIFSTTERRVAFLSKPRQEFEHWKEKQKVAQRDAKMTALGLTEEQKFWLRQPEHFFVPIQAQLYKEYGGQLKINDQQLRDGLPESRRNVWDALEKAIAGIDASRLPTDKALVALDKQDEPVRQYLLRRGSVLSRKEEVSAGFLQVLNRGKGPEEFLREARPYPRVAPADSPRVDKDGFVQPATTYQRKALALWLTDLEQGAGPLVARVIVNRIWQHHFGEGFVRTPDDFGYQSDAPSHPQLLEWLAAELVRHRWQLKPLHKLILMSAAYRQDTEGTHGSIRHPVRLESDALRDTILAVSGQLNRKMFGPAFRPIIPKEAMATRSKDEYPSNIEEGPEIWRRSVYAFAKRSVPNPLMEVFDAPDSSASCGRRNVTTVPTQALTLLNNEAIRKSAVQFAQRVITEVGLIPDAQIRRAYQLALSRLPTLEEEARALKFLAAAPDATGAALPVEGLSDLCHVLFTLNEFIYVD